MKALGFLGLVLLGIGNLYGVVPNELWVPAALLLGLIIFASR